MKPVDASLAFLRRWYRDEARVLTAIEPEHGFIRTEAFAAEDQYGQRRFVESWRAERGIYFQVNPDLRAVADIETKGKKEHISRAIALHCDLDSFKGDETREEGKARVLRMLTEQLPAGIPGPPSVINDSGNGTHAFWLLRTPIEIGGDVERAEALVEPYNRGLAELLGGDATTDVSRILRLPWTINWPNPKKVALGMTPLMTRQVLFDGTRLYDPEQFPRSEAAASRYVSDAHERAAARIIIGNAEPIESLEELRVPDRTKALIAVPAPVGKRSQRVRSVILSMISSGESDETILGVLTDPQWAVSESVLDKEDADAYARRQIARAHAWLSAQREFDDE